MTRRLNDGGLHLAPARQLLLAWPPLHALTSHNHH